jgi:hypothetical protein
VRRAEKLRAAGRAQLRLTTEGARARPAAVASPHDNKHPAPADVETACAALGAHRQLCAVGGRAGPRAAAKLRLWARDVRLGQLGSRPVPTPDARPTPCLTSAVREDRRAFRPVTLPAHGPGPQRNARGHQTFGVRGAGSPVPTCAPGVHVACLSDNSRSFVLHNCFLCAILRFQSRVSHSLPYLRTCPCTCSIVPG